MCMCMCMAEQNMALGFTSLDYDLDHHHHHHHHQQQELILKSTSGDNNGNNGMAYYLFDNPQEQQQQQQQQQQQEQHEHQHIMSSSSGFPGPASHHLDKLSFADVMQFADFGPKLGLNQTKISEDESGGIDPIYFLKFPVLNERAEDHNHHNHEMDNHTALMVQQGTHIHYGHDQDHHQEGFQRDQDRYHDDHDQARFSAHASVQLRFVADQDDHNHAQNTIENNNNPITDQSTKNKRKRARTIKTSEEVESQRMTHIAVERNRRKQMNEHLRVLRSLMPGSYVQRGDQASIIGGAIEFLRELEQLLQCLESQKRRRLLGTDQSSRQVVGDSSNMAIQLLPPPQPPFMPLPEDQMMRPISMEFETGLSGGAGIREETAENKSCLADVEVKLLGFDAMIKVLSRRRAGQLVKTIAALEDLQLNILHTNITTIEQTVLYSFNVKVGSESRFTEEDITSSVQQMFNFIHTSNN